MKIKKKALPKVITKQKPFISNNIYKIYQIITKYHKNSKLLFLDFKLRVKMQPETFNQINSLTNQILSEKKALER